MSEWKPCCEKFAKECGAYKAPVGAGMLYPHQSMPRGQIEFYKGWHVNGCCGGGCYVLSGIEYCPFCGSKLTPPPPSSDE